MATTKIFPITATTGKAIAYIAKAEKTDNGRLISTYMCSRDPDKAAKEFAEVTATGTGSKHRPCATLHYGVQTWGSHSRKSYGDWQGNVREMHYYII